MKYDIDPKRLEGQAERAADLLRAIASKHRIMILCRLLEGERSVGELVRLLGMTDSNLSQHLAKLRDEGLVATRRQGTTIYYRLVPERVEPLMRVLYQMFCIP